ncbi:MarR family transcriptional regulator [Deinococcus aquaticus]|uniref:Helix-turn-helix domain-containing protein n=1 Tax=Deinococcus aquaticus TaxID=328692 RepID=A0ABY7V6A5_9DEIO|nr:helix-turn-helix domain-containing protein [Deinococcus aquaticus]WDA60737.1 helix-turn-helix domain-containing protein [Deinococcus aquaticus]
MGLSVSSALAAPNPTAAEILRHVYHGSGVTRAELTRTLEVRAGIVAAALDAFKDAGLIHFDDLRYYPSLNDDTDAAARREYARLSGARTCRTCGCTDQWACEGGCEWIEEDLCSACDPSVVSLINRVSCVSADNGTSSVWIDLTDDGYVRMTVRIGEQGKRIILAADEATAVATNLLMYARAAEQDGALL